MGKVKALVGILIVVGAFYTAWNMVPPWFHNTQLQDDLDDLARKNSYTVISDDELKKRVIAKADDHDIKLKEDQITVTRTANVLGISVKYRIHMDLIVHQWDWDFSADSLNKRL